MSDVFLQDIEKILIANADFFEQQGFWGLVDDIRAGKIFYQRINSDGSTRRFCRVLVSDRSLCVAAGPGVKDANALAESRSAVMIGRHLAAQQVAVPQIFGWDADAGVILSEDAGDIRLHDQVGALQSLYAAQSISREEAFKRLETLYYDVVDKLLHMQFAGCQGFDRNWCYDGASYDREVMLQRESGYFYRAFWNDLLCGGEMPGIMREFEDIAERAGQGENVYFLHRDFQSRNILLAEQGSCFIDYQAGRIGPLGYDLASLLIDPYADLPERVQRKVFHYYLQKLQHYHEVNEEDFCYQFSFLALQRNLQIIGAYSFLYKTREKIFFRGFIKPALILLQRRLEQPEFSQYTLLKRLVESGLHSLKDFTI